MKFWKSTPLFLSNTQNKNRVATDALKAIHLAPLQTRQHGFRRLLPVPQQRQHLAPHAPHAGQPLVFLEEAVQDLFGLQQLLRAPVFATQHRVQRRFLVLSQLLQLLQLRLTHARLAHRRLRVLQQCACLQHARLHVRRSVQLRLPERSPRLLRLAAQEQHTRVLHLTPDRKSVV